jgi:hypothetical protein
MHGDGLVLLGRAAHINAVLGLAVGDHARAPAGDDAHGAVHGGDDLAAHLAQARVGQPPHTVHQRVQLFDHRRHGRHVVGHLERPLLAVLAALVQVLAIGAVAGDDVQRLAHEEVLERGAVHGCLITLGWLLLLAFYRLLSSSSVEPSFLSRTPGGWQSLGALSYS